MAKIIKFPVTTVPNSRPDMHESAKVIIFPGVRYERIADRPARKPRTVKRRKKA